MVDSSVIKQVLSISDDRSGDHAQDGFDFQASTAIYLMFNELDLGNDFSLVYEKIDDFIIFVDNIRIYQSKSTSKGLTDTVLSKQEVIKEKKREKKSATTKVKGNNNTAEIKTGLSIIEKLQKNMDSIKSNVINANVKAHLLWNKDYNFGANLVKNTKISTDATSLTLSDVSENIKNKIIRDTGLSKYEWEQIEIIRLLSKKNHEVFTCKYIEDVIYNLIGPNISYSKAFYATLLNEIRICRNTKRPITSEFLLTEINRLKLVKEPPRPTDYNHLLTDIDYKNQLIHSQVRIAFSLVSSDASPYQKAFKQIKSYIDKNLNNIKYPCDLYDLLKSQPEFDNLMTLYAEEVIKALIILAYLN